MRLPQWMDRFDAATATPGSTTAGDGASPQHGPGTRGAVWARLSDAAVAYAAADGPRLALAGVNLVIRRGEWLALVGPNASGKSTLGRVLAGLCPLSRGRIEVPDGPDGRPAYARIVLQQPDAQIVGATPWEDVCFTLEQSGVAAETIAARARQALADVGLLEMAHRPVDHLSGGQKQRLCIAGCLAVDPQAVVFDEATALLDPLAQQRVMAAAAHLAQKGAAVIWVTHRLEELAPAQRVVALADGRVVFDGTPASFFYGGDGGPEHTPCARLGFSPPFAVQVAWHLRARGITVPGAPILPEDLAVLAKGVVAR